MGEAEHQDLNSFESEEPIPDSFTCCVCLDLMYKPVVLSCGHISCFWCVYNSMNGQRDSYCPICRHTYNHFPNICQMLHFLLLKMYPTVYIRREEQILEEEKRLGRFSLQLDYAQYEHLKDPTHYLASSLGSNSRLDTCSVKGEKSCANVKKTQVIWGMQNSNMHIPNESPHENGSKTKTLSSENCEHISIEDVQCVACKELLFHPVVLNCGHVYCETCMKRCVDKVLRCEVCQSLHPRGFPKVCLEFNRFLESRFPIEYASRRDAVQLNQVKVKMPCPTAHSKSSNKEDSGGDHLPWWVDPQSKFHAGTGCDSCGVFPIVGDRYKCIGCVEDDKCFDLCEDCYGTPSKLPGRFNQQHTSEHKFELVQAVTTRDIMLNLVNGQLRNSSRASTYNEASTISRNVFATAPPVAVAVAGEDHQESNNTSATAVPQ